MQADLPLVYALIGVEEAKASGKIVPELLDLAEQGIVRFVDIVFIQKEKDGNTLTIELNDIDQASYEMFVPIGKHVSSLFTEQDLDESRPANSPNIRRLRSFYGKTCGSPMSARPSWMPAASSWSVGKLLPKWSRSSNRSSPRKNAGNRR